MSKAPGPLRAGLPMRAMALVLGCAALTSPLTTNAQGILELRENLQPGEGGLALDGYLRLRGGAFVNLDLDRGLSPEGAALFPVPLGKPAGQTLYGADTRLRADLAMGSPGGSFTVRLRTDVLDNLSWGSTPEGRPPSPRAATPAATPSQMAPQDAFAVKRAYAEVRTPIGLLLAGRMGSGFGLGVLSGPGDCEGCDAGDSADRLAFLTPLAGHVFALAFDLSASGPWQPRRASGVLDLAPADDVRTITVAAGRFEGDVTRVRRSAAGRHTFEYGAYVSHRWQHDDVPADYLVLARPVPIDAAQLMARGYRATATDAWARLTLPRARLEAELAFLVAQVDEPSLLPGVLYGASAQSRQLGGALQSELTLGDHWPTVGLDAGFASGDPAPGFGAYPAPGDSYPTPGELDGPQAYPPHDRRIDNFRFHPDFQVDRILFRELIGTVTDAVYVRPHAELVLAKNAAARLIGTVALTASRAMERSSTPGDANALGLELDPTLRYETNDGFAATLEYAYLWPLAGLDNPARGLSARPAQLAELRLFFVF